MNLHVDLDTAVLLILNLIGWGALFLTILYDRRHDRLSRSSEPSVSHLTHTSGRP